MIPPVRGQVLIRTTLALAGLAGLGGLTWLSIRLQHPVLAFAGTLVHPLRAWLLAAVAVVAGNALQGRPRTYALLLLGGVACPVLLGPAGWIPVLYALFTCAVARAPGGPWLRVPLLAAGWGGYLAARPVLPGWALPTTAVLLAWAALAYASLLVVLERARHREKAHAADELGYLLALPRLLSPFFQPMLPSYVRGRVHAESPVRGPLLGLGLGLLALGLTPLGVWLASHPPQNAPLPVQATVALALAWLQYARGIFAAVALFRLMGFDLASGFKAPFLATSYADFFRRWNHYVRDTVSEAFFVPLYARLSARVHPRAAAVLAGYGAILVGILLMSEALVPVVGGMPLRAITTWTLHPVRLGVLALFWTLVVVPEALGVRLELPGGRPLPRPVRTLLFLASLVALTSVMLAGGTRP
ncbi:MAG: hypothetical protein RL653_1214 [Pseudomonadota bacterium]